jgi:FkbM family methyltransferase
MKGVKYSKCLQPLQYWNGTDHQEPPEQMRKTVKFLTHRKPHLSIPLHEVINEYYDIEGVIHVGAHTGQEWSDYEDNDITNVMMFEPLRSAFDQLRAKVPDSVECYCTALGNYTGVATLHTETANKGMSSSVLKPSKHLEQYPQIEFNGEELIHMERLDDIPFDRTKYNMLNVDVQGYELEVLKGAAETLRHIDVIYCEVSKEPLYEDAPKVGDIDLWLFNYGFERVRTEWIGGNWGEALYIRR